MNVIIGHTRYTLCSVIKDSSSQLCGSDLKQCYSYECQSRKKKTQTRRTYKDTHHAPVVRCSTPLWLPRGETPSLLCSFLSSLRPFIPPSFRPPSPLVHLQLKRGSEVYSELHSCRKQMKDGLKKIYIYITAHSELNPDSGLLKRPTEVQRIFWCRVFKKMHVEDGIAQILGVK